MKILILVLLLLTSHLVYSQSQNAYFFDKNGVQTELAEEAVLKIKRTVLSDAKFELVEFDKVEDKWVNNRNKLVVCKKSLSRYLCKSYLDGKQIRSDFLEVIDTTSTGFVIQEYNDRFIKSRAEVSSVFPTVYHGVKNNFTQDRIQKKSTSYYYENLRYKNVEQPEVDNCELPLMIGDEMPQYPGGMLMVSNELLSLIEAQASVDINQIRGKYLIELMIKKSGEVVAKPIIDYASDSIVVDMLLDVCKSLKYPWRVARSFGQPVEYTYLLPFNFGMENFSTNSDSEIVDGKFNSSDVMLVVDKMPEYEGGDLQLRKDLAFNIRYPIEAQINGIQGKVFVHFVVDTDGKVRDVQVIRGVNSILDKEAIRVVKKLKKWIPGEHEGQKVKVYYTVPINFVLGTTKTPAKKHKKNRT